MLLLPQFYRQLIPHYCGITCTVNPITMVKRHCFPITAIFTLGFQRGNLSRHSLICSKTFLDRPTQMCFHETTLVTTKQQTRHTMHGCSWCLETHSLGATDKCQVTEVYIRIRDVVHVDCAFSHLAAVSAPVGPWPAAVSPKSCQTTTHQQWLMPHYVIIGNANNH